MKCLILSVDEATVINGRKQILFSNVALQITLSVMK